MRRPPLSSPRAFAHSATSKSKEKVSLPHFSVVNGELHAPASPRHARAREPENTAKTPIDHAIDDIQDVTAKIKASFERMQQTETAFDLECHELRSWIERIQSEQEYMTLVYVQLFQSSAIFIQRVFRGFLARRIHREALALRATLKIQRAFRAKQVRRAARRQQFRVLFKKVLRGMKGIVARHKLTHNELLNRVGHNMMIERQWRMAMGVADTDIDLLHALYRRKFARQRVATLFQNVVTMCSIVGFWQRLVPLMADGSGETQGLTMESVPLTQEFDNNGNDDSDESHTVENPSSTLPKPSLCSLAQQLTSTSKQSNKSPVKPGGLTRDELRHRQKLYTHRVYEENLKKEAVRAVQIERQREFARLAEEARKIHDDEQRRLRLLQALTLREDLERRGLLAIKELQSKKEEELRKEEAVYQRIVLAKQRIAKQVLSDETQMLLARRERGQSSMLKPKE